MAHFTSESDANLIKQMVLADVDVYIAKIESEQTAAVETESSNDITLTPVVSPAYVADAYNSAVGLNVVVQGDSSTLWIGKVKDTLTTGIVFDATGMVNIATGAAGDATNWTTAGTYSYYVLSPSAYNVWGEYFGYCKEVSLGMEQNNIEFEKGVPKESIVEDLLSMKYSIKGKNFNPSNEDVWNTIMGGAARGSTTSQWESHMGFTPATRSFYRITLVGQNRDGKAVTVQAFRTQMKIDGEMAFSTDEYKSLGWIASVKKDSLRPDAYNAMMVRVAE